ncbi:MAG: AAA family ATPase [Candidatus Pacearchaeota archaeon]|jgi:putative nucleotidyltransferase with HDIG domain|nr:AAA family ATPase [Clostridia bacterium]
MSKFYDYVVPQWKELHPYLNAMSLCEQNPDWHGEGDVLTHTKMVLDEFEKICNELDGIDEELSLCAHDITIINYALLLHDIAKPIVSKLEDGKIRAHGHEATGAKIAWELLENLKVSIINGDKMPILDRIEICNLILYHGKPTWLIDKTREEQERSIIKMSQDCRMDNLYYMTKSDFKGRIASDIDKRLEAIDYFLLLAFDLDLIDGAYEFGTGIAKYKYLVERTHHHSDCPFDDTKSTVCMMVGLPGSGKDYYISKHMSGIPVISLDEIRRRLKIKPTDEQGRVIQEAKKTAKEYMAKGIDFVWNATNITRQMREGLISLFTSYKAYVKIIFIATPYADCVKQNLSRTEKEQVPLCVMDKMRKKLEVPLNIEAHELHIVEN